MFLIQMPSAALPGRMCYYDGPAENPQVAPVEPMRRATMRGTGFDDVWLALEVLEDFQFDAKHAPATLNMLGGYDYTERLMKGCIVLASEVEGVEVTQG
jgi:hypothetical protein